MPLLHFESSLGLSPAQLDEIRLLATDCNRHENLQMKLNWDLLKSRWQDQTNDFFVWDRSRLVGYLALYAFNEREAEVSAMVHPSFRQRGIFRDLLAAARTELHKRKVEDFLFITERNSSAAKPVMDRLGAPYDFSEYKMKYEGDGSPIEGQLPPGVSLRPARVEDIPKMAALDRDCFSNPEEGSVSRYQRTLGISTYEHLLIEKEGAVVGKILISSGAKETRIFGFCVLAELRGHGIGGAAFKRIVARLVNSNAAPVVLEVGLKNEAALGLYTRSGFGIESAYDYYRLPVG